MAIYYVQCTCTCIGGYSDFSINQIGTQIFKFNIFVVFYLKLDYFFCVLLTIIGISIQIIDRYYNICRYIYN